MYKILHITPHLGGGVGKAITTLILNDKKNSHKVLCLEKPKTKKFYNIIKSKTKITSLEKEILKQIKRCDIIQIEYWPHPILLKILSTINILDKKIVFWCHFSGLGHPKFHKKLVGSGLQLILTTDVTNDIIKKKFPVISSASVLKKSKSKSPLKKENNFFYIGSLHKFKVHNDFLNIIVKNIEQLKTFNIYGENELIRIYRKKITRNSLKKKIFFHGFQRDVKKVYNKYRYLLYLLKKNHYGSAENVLIESMGEGVIPIVLNNNVEKKIIKNNYNGYILQNTKDLKNLLFNINTNKSHYLKISKNCKNFANNNFSVNKMVKKFEIIYRKLKKTPKINLDEIFLKDSLKMYELISGKKNSHNLYSYNKSGLNHFMKYLKIKKKKHIKK